MRTGVRITFADPVSLASRFTRLFAALALFFIASAAQADVEATWSLVENPFSASDLAAAPGFDGSQWVAYSLGVSTTNGSQIAAVDVTLGGLFHQRWSPSEESGTVASTAIGS